MKIQTTSDRFTLWFAAFCCFVALYLPLASALAQTLTGNKVPPNARISKHEVIATQVELRRLGFLKTGITGKLDDGTREAVAAYQRKNSLPVTGKITPATYEKLGLPYPAPDPEDKNIAVKAGGAVKEGTRYSLEKGWDAGGYAASKSKDAAKASWDGVKTGGRMAQRKADSMIRRNDEDTFPEIEKLFAEHPEWRDVHYSLKDGMVTLKLPPKSEVDVGKMVSEVRKIAGVRSVFVVAL
jgi:hypothetical protein